MYNQQQPQYGGGYNQQPPQHANYGGGNQQQPFNGATGYPPQHHHQPPPNHQHQGWVGGPPPQQPQYNTGYPPNHQHQQQQQRPPPQQQGFAPRYEPAPVVQRPPQQTYNSQPPTAAPPQVMPMYSSVNGTNNFNSTNNNLNATGHSSGSPTSATKRPTATRFDNQIVRPDLVKVTPVTVEQRRAKAKVAAVVFHRRLRKGLTEEGRKIVNQEIANIAVREETAEEQSAAKTGTVTGGAAAAVPSEEAQREEDDKEEQEIAEKLAGDDIDEETAVSLAVAARGEHNRAHLGLCDGPRVHMAELGSAVVYYFEFIKFIAAITLIFAVLQIIHYAKFADQHKPPFNSRTTDRGTRSWFDDFMITGYTSSDYATWMAMNIMAIILTFFAGPIYYFIMWRREVAEDKDSFTTEGLAEKTDRLLRIDTATGLFDVSHHYRTNRELTLRRVGGFLIISTFLGVQVVASYFLTRESSKASIGIAFAIAIIAGVLTGFFTFVSQFVVEFMKIQTYEKWKLTHTISLMGIRLGNVIAVYAAKNYTLDPDTKCAYDIVGQQFITLLFVEIFVMNVVNITLFMLQNKLADYIAIKTKSVFGDEDNLPPFDLATFYLNIVYRHYIVIMAMVVAPMTVCLAFLGFILQYWVDKFLLFKICGTPRRIYSSQKLFLSVTLCCAALCSLLTPYAGSMFIMSGITGEFSDLCAFPRYR